MEFEQLSPEDQKEALHLLNQYTVSRVMSTTPRTKGNAPYRKSEAVFMRKIRGKLRKLLGPGFPALARQWKVARVMERGY